MKLPTYEEFSAQLTIDLCCDTRACMFFFSNNACLRFNVAQAAQLQAQYANMGAEMLGEVKAYVTRGDDKQWSQLSSDLVRVSSLLAS
jgi:FPC/CPF motif-containing protein YcgG